MLAVLPLGDFVVLDEELVDVLALGVYQHDALRVRHLRRVLDCLESLLERLRMVVDQFASLARPKTI